MHRTIYLIFLLLLSSIVAHGQLLDSEKVKKHFDNVFTQGLIIEGSIVWESSGLYGESLLTKWDLNTSKVIKQRKFDEKYFAEGLTEHDGKLYMITWREKTAFEIDKDTLETIRTLDYQGEGWGLTSDEQFIIMSNGTDLIQFKDSENFKTQKTIKVHINGKPLMYLNELEYIDGFIWANVWQTDYIVVIDPNTGAVVKNYHLPNLLKNYMRKPGVLNGIAFDKKTKHIWVTGKKWPSLFLLR